MSVAKTKQKQTKNKKRVRSLWVFSHQDGQIDLKHIFDIRGTILPQRSHHMVGILFLVQLKVFAFHK